MVHVEHMSVFTAEDAENAENEFVCLSALSAFSAVNIRLVNRYLSPSDRSSDSHTPRTTQLILSCAVAVAAAR